MSRIPWGFVYCVPAMIVILRASYGSLRRGFSKDTKQPDRVLSILSK